MFAAPLNGPRSPIARVRSLLAGLAAPRCASLPWRRPRYELALLVLVALVALSPINGVSAQDESRICLAEALEHLQLFNDPCLALSSDRSGYHGHLYSDKAPGLSLLELPSVAAVDPGSVQRWKAYDGRLWLVRLLTVGIGFLVCVFLVGRVSEGLAPGFGGIAMVSFALGTLAGPLAATSFEHDVSAALGFGAFLLAWRRRPGPAGLLAGAALLVDYEGGLIVAALAAYSALGGWRATRRFLAGLVPAALLLGGYDWIAFGAPQHLSYAYKADTFAELQSTGFFGIGAPTRFGFIEVLAGSGGLLVISPVLLLAAYGLVLVFRAHPAEALLCAIVGVAYIVINMGYFDPYGGPLLGPRFLVPALPFLAVGLGPAFRAKPRLGALAALGSIVPVTALTLVWQSGNPVRGTIWKALAHLPARLGHSVFVHSLTDNVFDRLGASPAASALLVAGCAAAALLLGLASGPRAVLRGKLTTLHPPRSLRALLAGIACVYLVAGADACAVFAYPYGSRTLAGGLPNLVTSISASSFVALPGDEVNFVVTVANTSATRLTGLTLTIRLPPGMQLLGRPAYTRGSGCRGSATLSCFLDYLPPNSTTAVRLGVRISGGGYPTLTASSTAFAMPGRNTPAFTVTVGN